MKRFIALLCVICLGLAVSANAAVQKGDTEIELLGGWANINFDGGGDIDIYGLMGSVGYFVTDAIQVSGSAMGLWMDVGGTDVDLYGLGIRGKYHFMTDQKAVPYVGGQLFWTTIDAAGTDVDGIVWGPVAGLRYELNENNDLFVEYQLLMFEEDFDDPAMMGLDDSNLIIFGIVHQFK